MKKILVVILFSLFLQYCSGDEITSPTDQLKYKQIAYNSLSDAEKASLTKDWQNSDYKDGNYRKDTCDNTFAANSGDKICFAKSDSTISLSLDQKLCAVIFNTTNDALLGPIIDIVDPQTEKTAGYALRL